MAHIRLSLDTQDVRVRELAAAVETKVSLGKATSMEERLSYVEDQLLAIRKGTFRHYSMP